MIVVISLGEMSTFDTWNTRMIFDVHTHVWTAPHHMVPTAAPRLVAASGQPWHRQDAGTDAHRRAAEPVDISFVHGLHSEHAGVSVGHKQVAAIVEQQPKNLLGFAGIDPLAPGLGESVEEAHSLGLVGVTISPAGQDMQPSHTRAMRLYELCETHGLVVFVHGGGLFGDRAVLEYARPELFSEVARSFTKLHLVLAEIGRPWIEPTLSLLSQHANVYADVSGLVSEPWQLYNALLLAHQFGVAHKLLFASGFPFYTARQAILNLYSINNLVHGTNLPTISRQLLRGIVERDVPSCLGIDPRRIQLAAKDESASLEAHVEQSPDSSRPQSSKATAAPSPLTDPTQIIVDGADETSESTNEVGVAPVDAAENEGPADPQTQQSTVEEDQDEATREPTEGSGDTLQYTSLHNLVGGKVRCSGGAT